LDEVSIRPERPGDENAVRALVEAAFAPSTEEGRIVDDLRHDEAWIPSLSLVAIDGNGTIVGQCLTTAGHLDGDDGTIGQILTLGPIAVAPDQQGRGIGRALMEATIAEATALGWPVIVLVGHSTYYPRFGFGSARSIGLVPPQQWSDDLWMALRLPGWTPDLIGRVRYAPAFAID
jgi:putative acetyltransferase